MRLKSKPQSPASRAILQPDNVAPQTNGQFKINAPQPAIDTGVRRYQRAWLDTLRLLQASIQEYMPASAYRDFCLWALSEDNPQQDLWLQVLGVKQIVQFCTHLTGDLVADEVWGWMSQHMAAMNIYLVYEAASDNMAIGLALRQSTDTTYEVRHELVHQFNEIMCDLLANEPRPTVEALAPLHGLTASLSSFEQSLSPDKHETVAQAYLRQHPQVIPESVEYGAWALLLANAATAMDLSLAADHFSAGRSLKRGLLERYRSADRLLMETDIVLEERVAVGTYAILLIPVLAHYVEGVIHANGLRERVALLDADDKLWDGLYLTAQLVRLLNDCGTRLIEQSAADRATFIQELQDLHTLLHPQTTLLEFLGKVTPHYGGLMTRIHKDIKHGEVNMVFDNIDPSLPVAEALTLFGERLAYLSEVYRRQHQNLLEVLDTISERLEDGGVSKVLYRCVAFHEKVYSRAFEQPEGDFAV